MREYNIQKELVHPRIVRLLDLFEIDAQSFATVLEVAAGGDLASHLQLNKVRFDSVNSVTVSMLTD